MRILLVGVAISILACGGERWSGYFYPDATNLRVHTELGTFGSLEDCRAAAEERMHPGADYECGLNCERRDGIDVNICERTER